MTVNPLLQTLRMIEALSRSDASAETLCKQLDASSATVKRYLNEARDLGADIRSVRVGAAWVYELRNADSVMSRTMRWIDLEEKRDLRA
jgi:biotin operon repressor